MVPIRTSILYKFWISSTEHLARDSTKNVSTILSPNQVFDSLLKFNETQSWRSALAATVPKRKGFIIDAELWTKIYRTKVSVRWKKISMKIWKKKSDFFSIKKLDNVMFRMLEGRPCHTIYVNNLNDKVKKLELIRSLYSLFSSYGMVMSNSIALKSGQEDVALIPPLILILNSILIQF